MSDETEIDAIEPQHTLIDKVSAEMLGTFIICFTIFLISGISSIALNAGAIMLLPFAVLLAYAVCYFLFARVSGGYFNPAISIAMAVKGRITWAECGIYSLVQIVGGVLAAGLLRTILPSDTNENLGGVVSDVIMRSFVANGFGDDSPMQHLQMLSYGSPAMVTFGLLPAIFLELIGIIIIASIYLYIRNDEHSLFKNGVIIGFGYAAATLITYVATGAALNPARAIGAAVFSQNWSAESFDFPIGQLWLFVAVPIVGALLTVVIAGLFSPGGRSSDFDEFEEYDDSDYESEKVDDLLNK